MEKPIVCKKCKEPVAAGIKKCPQCGQSHPTVTAMQSTITAVVMIAAVVIFMKACEKSPAEEAKEKTAKIERECSNKISAQLVAEKFIKGSLKSPSTADFPFSPRHAIYKGDCLHLIDSYVDSQNGFGATIRSQTSVSVRFNKERNQWALENISIK